MRRIQKDLCDHIIVAGFGRSGSKSVEELLAKGVLSERMVAIDCDPLAVERAKSLGLAGMEGDASDNEVLAAARVERAAALIVSVAPAGAAVAEAIGSHQKKLSVPAGHLPKVRPLRMYVATL